MQGRDPGQSSPNRDGSAAATEGMIRVEGTREVGFALLQARDPRALLVLGHGAGAGMRHPFLERYAAGLSTRGIATLRFQFPYMQRGSRRPDPAAVLMATCAAASESGRDLARALGVSLFAGGKSMGGRMTSMASADGLLPVEVSGLVMVGYPLAAPGRSLGSRAAHLDRLVRPILFLQGTRDKLADLDAMRAVCTGLGDRASLHVVEGADHSFHVLRRSGRTDEEVLGELVEATARWILARPGATTSSHP